MSLSRGNTHWFSALCVVCLLSSLVLAQGSLATGDVIYVDFAGSTPPAGNWNSIVNATGTDPVLEAVTDAGITTGIGIEVTERMGGTNTSGTTNADPALGWPVEATQDSFWGNDVLFSGVTVPEAQIVISGVSPSGAYELTLFASRMGVTDNRQTQYTISGSGGVQETLLLNVDNNEDTQVISGKIQPTAAGEIIIDLQKGPDNTNGYGFYYIGALALRASESHGASGPQPAAGAEQVLRDVTLSWTSGGSADTHDVYFGVEYSSVNDAGTGDATYQGNQDVTTFDPGMLELGQTYYWRIDEVNTLPDQTVFKGDTWSFSVEPFSYAIPVGAVSATASSTEAPQDPTYTVDGSGLLENDAHSTDIAQMWACAADDVAPWIQFEFTQSQKLDKVHVWNHNTQTESVLGYGIKEALIETSQDGAAWSELGTVELAQASGIDDYAGIDVALNGIMAKFVKLTALSNHNLFGLPQKGLSEVRFYAIPVLARNPLPADGGTSDSVEVSLDWAPGHEALEHEVVFDTDEQAVIDGSAVVATVTESTYDLGTLDLGTAYFWKINEMNDLGTPPLYEGDLWSFLTPDDLMVDDFEMYQAIEGLRIWEYWIDGFDNPAENGAVVGNIDEAEKSVVYEGRQSMPIAFNNTTASKSEVTRVFDAPVDLTRGNPESLRVQVRGAAPGFIENTDGTLTVGAAGADIWNTADDFRFVYKRLSGNGSITAKVNSTIDVDEWTKAGVMIRENLSEEATNAYSFTTPRGRAGTQWRDTTFGTTVSTRSESNGTIALPYWVRITRQGTMFKGEQSVDGVTWLPMIRETVPDDPTERDITMIPDVYIGLAVTSHVTGTSTVAVFSEVTTTGTVTGPWISEAIGADTHPNNEAAPMYLVLTDTTGKEITLDHPDPAATSLLDWDAWTIPLSELSPLDPAKIDAITIGVSGSGVTGKVYIDAIRTHRDYAASGD